MLNKISLKIVEGGSIAYNLVGFIRVRNLVNFPGLKLNNLLMMNSQDFQKFIFFLE